MITLKAFPSGQIRQTAKIGDDEFTLFLRRPTYEERITDKAMQTAYAMFGNASDIAAQLRNRLTFVEGWEGVNDQDGNAVTFSTQVFTDAFCSDHSFALAVQVAVNRAWDAEVIPEIESKN